MLGKTGKSRKKFLLNKTLLLRRLIMPSPGRCSEQNAFLRDHLHMLLRINTSPPCPEQLMIHRCMRMTIFFGLPFLLQTLAFGSLSTQDFSLRVPSSLLVFCWVSVLNEFRLALSPHHTHLTLVLPPPCHWPHSSREVSLRLFLLSQADCYRLLPLYSSTRVHCVTSLQL